MILLKRFWLLVPLGLVIALTSPHHSIASPPATYGWAQPAASLTFSAILAHAESPSADSGADDEGGAPHSGWSHFVRWAGHFHPAMTVFPIGVLLAAVIAELLFMMTRSVWLDGAARFCVIVSAIGGLIAAPLGWAFALGHGSSWILQTHRWLGTAGAVWLLALLVVSETRRRRGGGWHRAYRAGLFLAAPAVVAIGFFGGAMVYGLHEYDWNPHHSHAQEETSHDQPANAPATGPSSSAVKATVRMTDDMSFAPEAVTISAGDTVRWNNSSTDEHSVTADPKHVSDSKDVSLPAGAEPFDSGKVKPGGSYEHRFTVPGTYKYVCVPHEEAGMTGQVMVKAKR